MRRSYLLWRTIWSKGCMRDSSRSSSAPLFQFRTRDCALSRISRRAKSTYRTAAFFKSRAFVLEHASRMTTLLA